MVFVPLDVSYYDDDKIIAAGERAEVLYVRALAVAKRLMTDGFVSDAQLARLHLPGVAARAKRLGEVGLWERVEGGWQIVAWLKHNEPAAEVAAAAERKRQAALLANHERWHSKGRTSPTCPLCESASESDPESSAESSSESIRQREDRGKGRQPPPPPAPNGRANGDEARRVAEQFYDSANPKPATSQSQVRDVVARLLTAGWSPDQVTDALPRARAYTLAAVEFVLRQANEQPVTRTAELEKWASNGPQ